MATKALQKSATVAKTAARFVSTIGEMIDQTHQLRERKRALQLEMDAIEGEYKGIEEALMEALGAADVTASRGTLASVSISTSVKANPVDWDAFYKWVKRTGHFHLMHKRISDAAYVEMLELKGSVPGLEPFHAKRLNVRSL